MKKKTVLLLLLLSMTFVGHSQSDVYSFFKLIITNPQKQILLVNWDGAWELPGDKYSKALSTSKFIESIAFDHGITINSSKIRGLFTFHYTSRPNPTLMQYYTANFQAGELKIPADCSNIGWFSKEEALKLIPYFEMKLVLQKILSEKKKIWGGAFTIEGTGKNRSSSILENLYYLN
jgi:hypothetical protein